MQVHCCSKLPRICGYKGTKRVPSISGLNFFLTIELYDSGILGSLPAQMGPNNEKCRKKLHSNVFLYKQICNVAPAMFRETSQGGELDNLTLYDEKVARKYGPRGGKGVGEF